MPKHLQLPLDCQRVAATQAVKVKGQIRVGLLFVNEWLCQMQRKHAAVGGRFILFFCYGKDVGAFLFALVLNVLVFHDS